MWYVDIQYFKLIRFCSHLIFFNTIHKLLLTNFSASLLENDLHLSANKQEGICHASILPMSFTHRDYGGR